MVKSKRSLNKQIIRRAIKTSMKRPSYIKITKGFFDLIFNLYFTEFRKELRGYTGLIGILRINALTALFSKPLRRKYSRLNPEFNKPSFWRKVNKDHVDLKAKLFTRYFFNKFLPLDSKFSYYLFQSTLEVWFRRSLTVKLSALGPAQYMCLVSANKHYLQYKEAMYTTWLQKSSTNVSKRHTSKLNTSKKSRFGVLDIKFLRRNMWVNLSDYYTKKLLLTTTTRREGFFGRRRTEYGSIFKTVKAMCRHIKRLGITKLALIYKGYSRFSIAIKKALRVSGESLVKIFVKRLVCIPHNGCRAKKKRRKKRKRRAWLKRQYVKNFYRLQVSRDIIKKRRLLKKAFRSTFQHTKLRHITYNSCTLIEKYQVLEARSCLKGFNNSEGKHLREYYKFKKLLAKGRNWKQFFIKQIVNADVTPNLWSSKQWLSLKALYLNPIDNYNVYGYKALVATKKKFLLRQAVTAYWRYKYKKGGNVSVQRLIKK